MLPLSSHRAIRTLAMRPLHAADWLDIDFGIRMGVDFIAVSFVKSADVIKNLKVLPASSTCDHCSTRLMIQSCWYPAALATALCVQACSTWYTLTGKHRSACSALTACPSQQQARLCHAFAFQPNPCACCFRAVLPGLPGPARDRGRGQGGLHINARAWGDRRQHLWRGCAGRWWRQQAWTELALRRGACPMLSLLLHDAIRYACCLPCPAATPQIESQDSLPNLASIVDASDGIMVARGDLGEPPSPLLPPRWLAMLHRYAQPCCLGTTQPREASL